MAQDRFKAYLTELSDEIGQGDLVQMVKLCGGLTPSIQKRERELLVQQGPLAVFEKLIEIGHLSTTQSSVLVKLLQKIKRSDLAEDAKVRYRLGFDRDVTQGDMEEASEERKRNQAKHRLRRGPTERKPVKKVRVEKVEARPPEETVNVFGLRRPSTQTSMNNAITAEHSLLTSNKTIKTKRGRVMIVGQFGVGKTSLKRSLFKEEFNPRHDSTRGIELVRFSIDISNFFAVADKTKGTPTQIAMRGLLAEEMRDILQKRQRRQSKKSTPNHNFAAPQRIDEDIGVAVDEEKKPFLDKETAVHKDELEVPGLLSQLTLNGEDEQTLLEHLNVNMVAMDMNSFCDFGLWDFAGQSIYYTTHQVFLDNKSIYILVADASRDLDDDCPMDECESRGERQCWKKKMKYKDYLTFWLNSIHTCSKKSTEKLEINGQKYSSPLVILVATKKDELSQDRQDEFVHDVRLYLAEACEEAFDAHVFQETFMVDNRKSGTEEEDPEIERLRECLKEVSEVPIFTEDVPVRWLRLELVLKALKDLNKHVVTISFFKNTAAKLGIGEEESEKVLEYFHKTGITYHFEDLLVLEAKWLTTILGRVISIKLGDVPFKHPKKERFLIDLRRHGILHEELLDLLLEERQRTNSRGQSQTESDFTGISQIVDLPEQTQTLDKSEGENDVIWKRRSEVFYLPNNNNLPVGQDQVDVGRNTEVTRFRHRRSLTSEGRKRLVELLKNFDLVFPLNSKHVSTAYIVPSLLQLDRLEVLPLGEQKSYHTLPLCYHFSGGFLPEGFYYRLVVRCLENWREEIDETTLRKNLKYHHARIPVSKRHRMTLTKIGSDIVMVMWYSTTERTFKPFHPKPDPAKCREVRIFVEEQMNDIISTWMPSLRYETRVRCSCEGHKKKYQDSDSEKWIGDNDFVFHDVKVEPPYQVTKECQSVPEMNLREGIEQTRKYVGPYRVQCTEMPCMMDLAPVKTWFGVSHPLKMAAKEFMERLPKLGVVTFVCLIFVFVSVFVLGIESVLIKCQAIPSVAGIILLSQCVATFIILICAFVLATWMCIFYSRDDDEYRTVRALFLVVLSVTFLYLPMFTREIAKMTEDCPEEEVTSTRLGNNTST